MSRKIEKCETHLKMGGMTQFAGQEKVGGAWASEVAKCMQYPLTQDRLYIKFENAYKTTAVNMR